MTVAYEKCCFVIMPYGIKTQDGVEIDFDTIYEDIHAPGIERAELPEGGELEPRRTDQDQFAGDIAYETFLYLEHSRLVLADITFLNANVFYELGIRHHARDRGTVLVRILNAAIPFDISSVRVFEYDAALSEESRQKLAGILTKSLKERRPDSPPRMAVAAEKGLSEENQEKRDRLLWRAENSIRRGQRIAAIGLYKQAVEIDPEDPELRTRLGILHQDEGQFTEALLQFSKASEIAPDYLSAKREMGNILSLIDPEAFKLTGKVPLETVVSLDEEDTVAKRLLADLLNDQKRFQAAIELYEEADAMTPPDDFDAWLGSLTARGRHAGYLELDTQDAQRLVGVVHVCQGNINPPYPDALRRNKALSEVTLYTGDETKFLDQLDKTIKVCREPGHLGSLWRTLNDSKEIVRHKNALDVGLAKLGSFVSSIGGGGISGGSGFGA